MSDKDAKSECDRNSPSKDSKAAGKVNEIVKKKNIMDKMPPVLGKKAPKSSESGAGKSKKRYTIQDRIKDIKTGIAEIKSNIKERKNQFAAASGAGSPGSKRATILRGRQMIYPYTLTAKIAQFPFKFHWEKAPFFKYFLLGSIASWPVFVIIGRKSYSPANVEMWRKEREELLGIHDSS